MVVAVADDCTGTVWDHREDITPWRSPDCPKSQCRTFDLSGTPCPVLYCRREGGRFIYVLLAEAGRRAFFSVFD